MLIEVNCSNFFQKKLSFEKGLNVVVGDDVSSNSIGKSTLLMILDFVFGGNDFLKKDSGSIAQFGQLDFDFVFRFDDSEHHFRRSTKEPNTVYNCDMSFKVVGEIELKEYRENLKKNYTLKGDKLSFRDAVNLFSRIWLKQNYSVEEPLASHVKESKGASIIRLLKVFDHYDTIQESKLKVDEEKLAQRTLKLAFNRAYVPKINKTKYTKNLRQLEENSSLLDDIQQNMLKYTMNSDILRNADLVNLKKEKSQIIQERSLVENKINRLESSLNETKIKSVQFEKLVDFFPNVNQKKIEQVENFHSGISKILKSELKKAKKLLLEQKADQDEQIMGIDIEIGKILKNVENPAYIVDKVYELTMEKYAIQNENKFYDKQKELKENVNKRKEEYSDLVQAFLTKVERAINDEIKVINDHIHGVNKESATLNLEENRYEFDHPNNTGTGKSYSDFILLDLAVFSLTDIPFLIHDSMMFKNIDDQTQEKLVKFYSGHEKQVFIAIDAIQRFSPECVKLIKEKEVVYLSANEKLFGIDWSVK